ncbi:MAG: pyridoxamine 5'-phosphate oxidase family protein [Acidobacteria bacterium]|nr:pyridoxamine 5'-phosphate oxidase family protein [Acidobacteriota bacterium]
MLKVQDMPVEEMRALLQKNGFGHLGCTREGRPYVVPMHYVYDSQDIYFFTTEGMKTQFIESNSEVCLQVEEVKDERHWRSVMATGRAEKVTDAEGMERAMQIITARNPTLTPAINETQLDAWGRANNIVIYRLRPDVIDGRKTMGDDAPESSGVGESDS